MDPRRLVPPASAFLLTALVALATAQENTWVSHGPTDAGMVNDVVVVDDSVAYAATPNGVFRSNDGGVSWQPTGLARQWIFRIIAPSGGVVLAMASPGDLYASRDEGETWTPVGGVGLVVGAAVDPGQRATVYAGGADDGIWRSTDSGATWQRLSTTPTGTAIASFAFDSRAIYVRAIDETDGRWKLYRSSDGGVSWAAVSTPLTSVSAIATSATPGVVYAVGPGSFCRTTDSAATWSCSSFPDYPAFEPSFFLELPSDGSGSAPRILSAAPGGMYVSSDGGATWAPQSLAFGLGVDVGTFGCDASGSFVLAGTSVGIFRSEDRGNSWTPASLGLQSSVINVLAVDPHDPWMVWAVGEGFNGADPGLFRSTDAGFSWSRGDSPASQDPFGVLVIDPAHPSTLYWGEWFRGGSGTVDRSDDGGTHWTTSALPGGAALYSLAADPGAPGRLWAASTGGLFRSDDGARTWSSTPALTQAIYSVLFDSKRPGTMYAGSYFDYVEGGFYPGPEGGSIFVSQDGGASWVQRPEELEGAVLGIATDPSNDGVLYAKTDTGILRSANAGRTWQGASVGLPPFGVLWLVADPVRPGRLYCTTGDGGVYRTIDGAQTWDAFSNGLGSLRVQSLAISPDGRWLHAGTFGGGVFEFDLAGGTPPPPCITSATRLCLLGNRYAVDLLAGRAGEFPNNPGAARSLSDRAGYFALPFATSDPELPEVVIKMFPDGTFGSGGAPIFYSSLTTLPYILTVTDTVTGRTQSYASNPDAPLCGGTDLSFGASGSSTSPRAAPVAAAFRQLEKGWVVPPEPPTLSLLGGRFLVALEARRPGSGEVVRGATMSSADRFGFFSLPDVTGDPTFPEVVVKMLDATALDGNFWFFHTGLTSLAYTLTVTDSVTTVVRTYESGTPFCGSADTQAFSDDFLENWQATD